MRLLLFSDLHTDTTAAERIVQRAHDADVVVGAGDLATVHRGLPEMIAILRRIDRPAVLVPGNSETYEELRDACSCWSAARVLHGTGVTIRGTEFFGLGGGVPVTPFGSWSYDFTEEEAARLLGDCPPGAVLVSHSPPKGTVDSSSSGESLGSTAVLDVVVAKAPALVVCGHIHGSGGRQERIGGCPVVNAGPRGVEWELDPRPR